MRKTYRKSKVVRYWSLYFYCIQTLPSFRMITKLEFQDTEASQPEGVKTTFGGQGTSATGLSIKFSAYLWQETVENTIHSANILPIQICKLITIFLSFPILIFPWSRKLSIFVNFSGSFGIMNKKYVNDLQSWIYPNLDKILFELQEK